MRPDKERPGTFSHAFWMIALVAVVAAAGLGYFLWPRDQAPSGNSFPGEKTLASPRILQADDAAPVEQLLFYPDGSQVVSVQKGGQLVAWDLSSGQKATSVNEDPSDKGAEIFDERRQQRQQRKQLRALVGHLLAAAPGGLPALLPVCLAPETVAEVCKQAERERRLQLRHFSLVFANGPLAPLALLPGLLLEAAKTLRINPPGIVGLKWSVRKAPRAYCIGNGPDGPVLLEYVGTQFRYASVAAEDRDDSRDGTGRGSKEVVITQLKLKVHTFKDQKAMDTTITLGGFLLRPLGFSAGGLQLLLADRAQQLLMIENKATDRELNYNLVVPAFKNLEGRIEPLLLLPNGKRALMADENRAVGIWDLETTRQVQVLEGLWAPLLGVAGSSDGKRIVAWNRVKGVGVWNAATGAESRRLNLPQERLRLLALSADGSRLLTSTDDKVVRVWDVDSSKVLRELPPREEQVTAVALSADGRRAAVAGGRTIQVWDLSP